MHDEEIYPALLEYIFDYQPGFMNENEKKSFRHQLAVQRIEFGNRINFHKYHHEKEHVSKDEEVLKLLEKGYENYKAMTATRIYKEHKMNYGLTFAPSVIK